MSLKTSENDMNERKVPFYDYSIVNDKIKDKIITEINRIFKLKDNWELEKNIKELEHDFSAYCSTSYAIAVDSGTSALQLSLTALGIKEGDEVIIPAYGYIATALAVSNTGAKPVFCDIDEKGLTISTNKIETLINIRTKAIIPVHIHGNICDMETITEICRKHSISLIEDCCQSHGAMFNSKKTGTFGIGCFSFHTSKTLGGIGNSGIITLDDEQIYKNIKALITPDNNTVNILHSGRTPCVINPIQAAIVRIKLRYLDQFNKRKQEIVDLYESLISNQKIKTIYKNNEKNILPVYRDVCITCKERDMLQKHLSEKSIESKARYNIPLHLTKTYKHLGYKEGDLPASEKAAEEILCLPSFIGITDKQIEFICKIINKF